MVYRNDYNDLQQGDRKKWLMHETPGTQRRREETKGYTSLDIPRIGSDGRLTRRDIPYDGRKNFEEERVEQRCGV